MATELGLPCFKQLTPCLCVWNMLNVLFHLYELIQTNYRIKTIGNSDEKNSPIATAIALWDVSTSEGTATPWPDSPAQPPLWAFLSLHHSVPARMLLRVCSMALHAQYWSASISDQVAQLLSLVSDHSSLPLARIPPDSWCFLLGIFCR